MQIGHFKSHFFSLLKRCHCVTLPKKVLNFSLNWHLYYLHFFVEKINLYSSGHIKKRQFQVILGFGPFFVNMAH